MQEQSCVQDDGVVRSRRIVEPSWAERSVVYCLICTIGIWLNEAEPGVDLSKKRRERGTSRPGGFHPSGVCIGIQQGRF